MFGTNLNKNVSDHVRNPEDPVIGAIPRYLRYDVRKEYLHYYAYNRFYSWSFFVTVYEPKTGATVSFNTKRFPMEVSPAQIGKQLETMPGLINLLVNWHTEMCEKELRL